MYAVFVNGKEVYRSFNRIQAMNVQVNITKAAAMEGLDIIEGRLVK
jgi:hypothetical protein